MAKLTLRLPEVKSTTERPRACRYCGYGALQRWGVRQRTIRDTEVKSVTIARYRCTFCGRTFRAHPDGVGRSQQSQRVIALAAMLWAMGLSLRLTTAILAVIHVGLSHQTVWADAVKLAQQLRLKRRRGRVRVLGVDGAALRVNGVTRGVVVVMDVARGEALELLFLDEQNVDEMARWLGPLVEHFRAEVMVTDDLGTYSQVAERLTVDHHRCWFHMRRWTSQTLRSLRNALGEQWQERLDQIEWVLRERPAWGGHWLFELYLQIRAPGPSPGEVASPLYQLRQMLARLSQHWPDYTQDTRQDDVPATNNRTENGIGRTKVRMKTTRGMKSETGVKTLFQLCNAHLVS